MRTFKKEKVPRPKEGNPVPLDSLKGPFELDLGCGEGSHALIRAKIFKRRQIIAIEKSHSRFQRFNRLLERKGRPKNLWPVHTNGVWWLSHYGEKNMFKNIFLLYPNPYPKNRQSNLRWINRPFLSYLLTLLKPKGVLELRTNEFYYYSEFKKKIKSFKNIKIQKDLTLKRKNPPKTAFEKKYLEKKETCYVLEIIKTL